MFFPLYMHQSPKKIGKGLFIVGLTIPVLYIVFVLLEKYHPLTILWVKNGIKGFGGLLSGNAGDSMEKLFKREKWYFPEGVSLIFGTGHNIYEAEGYRHSDVGYVNDLWLFGIIGAILFYGGFFLLFLKTWKGSRENHVLAIFLAICFFSFNVKGQVIAYSTGNAILLLLCFFTIFERNRYKNKGKRIWKVKDIY